MSRQGPVRSPLGQERREALIRAAYSHIASKGFEGLRLRDVAAEAGITQVRRVAETPFNMVLELRP
jgi:DNA-binding transcriptional regulator YbjK